MICRGTALFCSSALIFVAAACGGSSPAAPAPAPTATPSPIATPNPAPEPTPTPQPTPTPCTYGLCDAPTTNTNPVVAARLKIYTVLDEQQLWIHDWTSRQPIKVGYTVRLDLTGKDGYNKDTLGERGVEIGFHYSDPSLVEVGGSSDWQPKLAVKQPGVLEVYAIFDGVQSNTLRLRFDPK